MTTWTEANFLERLKVPLNDAYEASASTCPDADMMSAYVENTASEFVRNAVEGHLRSCADCRELAERLGGFDAATDDSPAAMNAALQGEWVNAEKRLDISAEDFVRTAEVDFRKAARVAPAPALEREAAWQFPWGKTAWSVAAVAALVTAGFFLMRKDGATQTAQVSPPLAVPAATPSAATPANSGGKSAETANTAKAPPIAVANDSGTSAAVTPTVPDLGGAKIESEKPAAHGAANGAAKHTTTKRAAADNGSAVAANVPTDTGANTSAVAPSSPDTSAGTEAAANTSEPNAVASNAAPPRAPATSSPAGTGSGGGGRSGLNSFGSHATSAAAAKAPHAAASAPLPQSIQLSAGTRVWIVYKNVTRRSDSSFAFTGSLLEPITGTGSTPLAKDTEIDGEGAAVNGKTSLTVEQIVFRGVKYELKGSGGAVTQGYAGGGEAVTFNAGQVQELWLAAPATYEKAADTGANP
jgi:hypothetical protein